MNLNTTTRWTDTPNVSYLCHMGTKYLVRILAATALLIVLASCSSSPSPAEEAAIAQQRAELETAINGPTPTPVPPTPTPDPDQATEEERLAAAIAAINNAHPDARDVEVLDVENGGDTFLIETCIWDEALDITVTQQAVTVDPLTLETQLDMADNPTTEQCTNTASILDAAAHAQELLNVHTGYLSGNGLLDEVELYYSPESVEFYTSIAAQYLDPQLDYELRHFPTAGEPIGFVETQVRGSKAFAILLRLEANPEAGYYIKETGALADFGTNQPFTFDQFAGEEHVAGVLLDWDDGQWKFLLWDDVDFFNCEFENCVDTLNRFNAEVGHVESQGRDPNFMYDFALEQGWRALPEGDVT